MSPSVTIVGHTTASNPRPHILYSISVEEDEAKHVVERRYSEFVDLHNVLKDDFVLPPKRFLVTSFIPSAWVDDQLIAERKAGLAAYLSELLDSPAHKDSPALLDFLNPDANAPHVTFSLEDALPSTLSRAAGLEAAEMSQFGVDGDVSTTATAIAAAYYPDWVSSSRPPESLDFSKFDILFYAFATPNSSSTLSWDSGSQNILKRLIAAKKKSGRSTKIVLSIGGWSGSHWFSQAMQSSNRTKFKNAVVDAVKTFGLDGADIDWEYPNESGDGNPHSSADAANLLSFLQSLRSALGSSKIISAAVTHLPWTGANGNPLKDVSAYAKVMDYVNIMNYDVWGASSTPGPNAPRGDNNGTSKQPKANAKAALAQWTAAGFPARKLLLGLPLYGYVSKSTKTTLTGSFAPSDDMLVEAQSVEDDSDGNFLDGAHARLKALPKQTDLSDQTVTIEAAKGDLSSYWGTQIAFNDLLASGALVKKSDGTYVGGAGYTRAWDSASTTPFLYNVSRTTVVTYDDPVSLRSKAKLVKDKGMAGCFTWELSQDDGYALQNAIRNELGK